MNVAQAIGAALGQLGARNFFGLVGSGNFELTDALVRAGVTFYSARHECAAVSMADGYARLSGQVGIATVHQGPGLTNAMTAIAEAAKSRTPLLLLAADTSRGAVSSNFRIDQAGLARAVGAVAEHAYTPESALTDLGRAWRTARQRRTVVMNLPLDVQAAEHPGGAVQASMALDSAAPDSQAVDRIADLLASSRRPVIIGGRGAVLAGASEALVALGERVGGLLATSANGNGLFAGHRWSLGISGGFASPAASDLLASADLVISFGASLNMWTTRHGTLIGSGAPVVQVDVEADAIGGHFPVAAGMIGDARAGAEALVEALDQRDHRSEGFRTDKVAELIAAGTWHNQAYQDASTDDTIDPRALTMALDELLPSERIVALDSGHFMGWPAMYLQVPDAAGFVFNQGFQSVGLGLGSAIGAAVARPDRVTVACLGDGGALMSAGEFETLARLSLPMLVVIYDDAAYGAEVHHFGPQGHGLDPVRFADADLAGFAHGLGCASVTVRRTEDLTAVKEWLDHRAGPMVVDAKIVPTLVADWLQEAFKAH
ncbi:MAG: thiamine pyrophosphate-binding protein [Actinomycetota bacterium]|nr:thiamine pyrophosphate-binding protein [Actinomycetota bacterium]